MNFANYDAAYHLTEHLIEWGHKRIACIGYHKSATSTMERLAGVKGALKDYNLEIVEDYMIEYDGSKNGGYLCTKKLLSLEEKPTAIFAVNDYTALGAYEAISEDGYEVGKDMSVVGFDDVAFARFVHPALTTVHCDTDLMAECATELLMKKIDKESTEDKSFEEIILPSKIIIRSSVKNISNNEIFKMQS
jgi:DNA-binding LacI/PurR family transcriptional regulator